MATIKIAKYEVEHNKVVTTIIRNNIIDMNDAQLYIKTLKEKANNRNMDILKATKNTLLIQKQTTTQGDMKYTLFKVVTSKSIPVSPKEVKQIYFMMV